MQDQNLAVAAGSGADADGWHRQGLGDFTGQFLRNAFQNDGKNPRFLQSPGVVEQAAGSSLIPPLDLESAENMDRLRRQAQMPHNRNLGPHKAANLRQDI